MNVHIHTTEHHPIWAEINLEAILHNLNEIKKLIRPGVKTMGVIKANAYGHGSVEVAKVLEANGADYLGVARLDEAVLLRKAGIVLPVLVFGFTPPESSKLLAEHNITQTIFSIEYAYSLSKALSKTNDTITVHIKVDTGMGRLGLCPGEIVDNEQNRNDRINTVCIGIQSISELFNLDIEGIYTHLASSDSEDKTTTFDQLSAFKKTCEVIESRGLSIPIKHAANSAAVMRLPDSHLDMIRPGIMLYGCSPIDDPARYKIDLTPAMQLKAKISLLKKVPSGFSISYGHTYTTPDPTTIATIPLGYADGYDRRFSSAGKVLIHGQYAPVVGRVCMDQLMVDVGHISNVREEDEVVILGNQEGASITADDIATQLGTINYEVISTIMHRVPRVYVT